ncbi:hypothetical protein [Clostridium perfringens]|uniref:hypothetical protein n=1 Tax=Clostridium perfringens TaxID=1502 RepID=UPI003A101589
MCKIIEFPINNSSSVDSSILLEKQERDWSKASKQEIYEAYEKFYNEEKNYINLYY